MNPLPRSTLVSVVLLFMLVVVPGRVFADSPIWRVSDGENELYLAGTVHLLFERYLPLPDEFDEAYESSESIVLEINPGDMASTTGQLAMQELLYLDGSDLFARIEPETKDRLVSYFEGSQLPVEALQRMKPGLIMSMAMVAEMGKMGKIVEGPDTIFYQRASADGKPVEVLESVQEQVSLLASLGEEDPDGFINLLLDSVGEQVRLIPDLIEEWQVGEYNVLVRYLADSLLKEKQLDMAYMDRLIYQRNQNWVPRIEQLIASKTTEFILVGYGHLVGERGLLELLSDKGYRITPLE